MISQFVFAAVDSAPCWSVVPVSRLGGGCQGQVGAGSQVQASPPVRSSLRSWLGGWAERQVRAPPSQPHPANGGSDAALPGLAVRQLRDVHHHGVPLAQVDLLQVVFITLVLGKVHKHLVEEKKKRTKVQHPDGVSTGPRALAAAILSGLDRFLEHHQNTVM